MTTPYSAGGDPQRLLPNWLADRATAVRTFTYKDNALTLFARTADRATTADDLVPDGPPPAPLNLTLPDGYQLTGYAQAARDFKSGDTVHLALYGQGSTPITVNIGFIDGASSTVWGLTPVTLQSGAEIVRTPVDLIVPPEAPDGRYRLVIGDAAGGAIFGEVNIRQKDAAFLTEADVTMANRLDVDFSSGIRLLGYDLSPAAQPGESVALTLYWSSEGNIQQRYKVFTHVLGDVFNGTTGNFIWGQVDNEPASGSRPNHHLAQWGGNC